MENQDFGEVRMFLKELEQQPAENEEDGNNPNTWDRPDLDYPRPERGRNEWKHEAAEWQKLK